jgi:hypothetical protein
MFDLHDGVPYLQWNLGVAGAEIEKWVL